MPALVPVLIVLALLAAFVLGGFYLRYRVYEDLSRRLAAGDAAGVLTGVDRLWARSLLSPFARERLRFLALAASDEKDAGEKGLDKRDALVRQMNGLMKMRLNDAQRAMVLADGFDAFAQLGDVRHTRRILDEMAGAGVSERARASYQRHFDYVLAHKTTGWKDLESTYATLSGARRGYAAYLLSKVHESLNEPKEAAHLRAEASRLLSIPEEELDRRIHVNTTV